ncbi:GAF domain-containing protein [Streptomyces sp. NPDC006283]|uniref:sensor histidine kinase n=1 Tax=Streptomyces sp. NPDC006283 TaxID=3156741 RepID=UPI0033B448A1
MIGVGTDLDLHATLQRIVDTAAGLTGARYAALGVIEPERGDVGELFTAGSDATEEPVSDGAEEAAAAGVRLEERQRLRVPIRVESEEFGDLHLAGKYGGPFTAEDLALLQVLASHAGIAIGNARLYETARQRERWIEGAAAVTNALLTGQSADDALMTVAEQARILAGACAGMVLHPTEDNGMEIVAASAPDDPGDIVGTIIQPGSPILVQLLGGQPVFVDDSATDPRMTTHVRSRFGPSMLLPLQSGGRLIGTLALPRRRGGRPYTAPERLLATQFASQAALALVLADAQHDREQLAVYEDRDRIARDLHDLVVQRLFATEMLLESTRRRAGTGAPDELLGRAVDELDSTIQEVRTTIFTLQQPPADAPTTFRGRVLHETRGAAVPLGFSPSVHFSGAVDSLMREPVGGGLLTALRGALAAAHQRREVSSITVHVDATVRLPDGRRGVRLTVTDDGLSDDGERGTTLTWHRAL